MDEVHLLPIKQFKKINMEFETVNGKLKPFWVMSINNYICDASYIWKELKSRCLFPSFRKFYFIRDVDGLKYFTKRSEISNEQLVFNLLNPDKI